ncbi:MAG: hypothetical protein HY914_11450 [Desulfomonile tiedjei]|nr:hypothetical protein [Desulfomonile tiedjei]
MAFDEEIAVGPQLSQEFANFQEFCAENSGQELTYFEVVCANPLEMDPVTLAFSMRHLVRLSKPLMDMLAQSLDEDHQPDLGTILESKGIQLDKTHAGTLRAIFFAFRDCSDPESKTSLIRALQLMMMSRQPNRLALNVGESYTPPDEGWTSEDFGDDESLLATVRSIEDPYWIKPEE